MVEALVEVTHIDPQIQTNYGHLCREVKDLWLAGYTAADLHSLFGKGGVWYDQDWRGRRGQPPTIKQVRENIKRLQDQNTSPVFHGGVKLTPAQAEQRREHYRQLSRKRQLTPQSDPQKP